MQHTAELASTGQIWPSPGGITAGDDYRARCEAMQKALDEFRAAEEQVAATERGAKEKFVKRGKLLPRERIDRLLDAGAPFVELMSLAGRKMHDDRDGSTAGGGVIAGIGYVGGIRCLVPPATARLKVEQSHQLVCISRFVCLR